MTKKMNEWFNPTAKHRNEGASIGQSELFSLTPQTLVVAKIKSDYRAYDQIRLYTAEC